MPVHDWSRVDVGLYHHFHQVWTVILCGAINRLLPAGFSALLERHADPPISGAEIDSYAARGNRISIRHRLGDIVCVIELVSPGNKHSRIALRQFVEKAVAFLRSGVHLLIIDPFPPTPRDPQGIHRAIFDEIHEIDFRLPADKPLTMAAYEVNPESAGLDVTAYAEPVGVGDVLPNMPAYIDAGEYVPVPLEATYQAAWGDCPPALRELVETGRLAGEEGPSAVAGSKAMSRARPNGRARCIPSPPSQRHRAVSVTISPTFDRCL